MHLSGLAFVLAGLAAGAPSHEASILFQDTYGERLPASTQDAGLWWAESGWKVSRTRPLPRARGKAIEIRLAGNETEAAQLVVRPVKPLKGLTAVAEPLTGPNGASVPAERVEVLRVRYVNVDRKSDLWGAAAPWPDPLPAFNGPIDLAPNENQPLWVRVHAPKGAAPGVYQGAIALRAEGYEARAQLRVVVYGFDLPDRMTCSTAFGFDPGAVYRYQKISDPDQRRMVIEKYWADLSAHHISPYHPTPGVDLKVTWVKLNQDERKDLPEPDRQLLQANALTPVFDWTAWDAEMQRVFDTYHFESFRLGLPGMGGGEIQGFKGDTREHALAFTAYARAMQEHLRQKGWLDKAYVYWIDEPNTADYPYVMQGFQRLKGAAPDIRRMLTEQVEPELVGGPNLWCPLTVNYKHDRTLDRRKAGDHFWWYVCTVPKKPFCGLFIDHPATDLRVWLWQTWKYGIEGILIWQSNLWSSSTAYPDTPQNPYEDPMSWMTGYGTKAGDKRPWGNGDGRFMYPPEAAASGQQAETILDGPVDSIRWEMLRDGIEDYEYLAILKRLLDEKRGDLSVRACRRYEKLLEVPPGITRDLRDFTKDPAPIEHQRDRVACAIERLRAH